MELRYYCLKTKGAQYDAVAAESLKSFGIPVLFPRIKKEVKSLYGKAHTQTSALFPGYVFAQFDLGYFRNLGRIHGVATIVGQAGAPEEVSLDVIEEIKGRIGDDGFVRLSKPLKPGDRVEIIDGPFKTLTGVFVEGLSNDQRLKILFETLSGSGQPQQFKVELARAAVAPLQSQDCYL